MAGLGWLRTGAITVTNGGRNVGGTDTIWGGGVVNPGDIILLPNGTLGEVESVGSNTALTLKQAYTGATASAQPYAIIRMLPSGNVAADLAAQFTATSQRYHLTLDQFVSFLDSTSIVSFSDGDTTITGLHGLRKLMADIESALPKAGGVVGGPLAVEGNFGVGTSAPAAKLNIVGGQYIHRLDSTLTVSAAMSAGVINRVWGLSAPFGADAASVSNAGAKWGLALTGDGDNPTVVGGRKTAGIYAVSEDPAAGYNRAVGVAIHVSGFDSAEAEVVRFSSNGNLLVGTSVNGSSDKVQVAGSLSTSGPARIGQYTLSTLPSPSAYGSYAITVSNASGGPALCLSNGSSWINIRTNAPVN